MGQALPAGEVAALVALLPRGAPRLESLTLEDLGGGDAAGEALAAALEGGGLPSLKSLEVRYVGLGGAAQARVRAACQAAGVVVERLD